MTTGVATADQATRAPQVGSFSVVERLSVASAPEGQVLLRVSGADGTPYSGQAGLATCFAAPGDDAERAAAKALLDKLSSLRHPSLVPVLQAGLSGNVIYWVYPAEPGSTVPPPTPASLMPISTLATMLKDVAAGLSAAHEAGFSHGSLSLDSIVSPSPARFAVTGLGLKGAGPASDQRDLGLIAIYLLSGRAWQEALPSEPLSMEAGFARAQRVRDWMSGVTERVVNVVLRATQFEPADRYASVTEFAEHFATAVEHSGEDLVHGAFEAISSRNIELARLLAAKAAHYNPTSDNLTLLNLQLSGGSPFGVVPGQPATPPGFAPGAAAAPALTLPPMAVPVERQNLLSPELAQGLPPEFLEAIAPQFDVTKPKRGMNPMFVLLLGGVVIVFLLLVAAMATIFLTGS